MKTALRDRPPGGAAILVIEDDDILATRLQDGLIGAGYAARRAASAEEALTTLESTPADLILMSQLLPDTDGLILCSTLKACFGAPIIMLGARDGDVERALALESGAVDWLVTRPVNVGEVLARVESIVCAPASRR